MSKIMLSLDRGLLSSLDNESNAYKITINTLINLIIKNNKMIDPIFDTNLQSSVKKTVSINKCNRGVWDELLILNQDKSFSKIIRAYIASYLSLNTAKRERILYSDVIEKISMNIDNNKKLYIEYYNYNYKPERRLIEPYLILDSFDGGHVYLIGYCYLREELRVFRISRIKNIIFDESTSVNKVKFSYELKRAEEYFDGFLGYGEYVKIEFTKRGLFLLGELNKNKPRELSRTDIYGGEIDVNRINIKLEDIDKENIKLFECNYTQFKVYFLQFLNNINILEPKLFREQFIDDLEKAVLSIKGGIKNEIK